MFLGSGISNLGILLAPDRTQTRSLPRHGRPITSIATHEARCLVSGVSVVPASILDPYHVYLCTPVAYACMHLCVYVYAQEYSHLCVSFCSVPVVEPCCGKLLLACKRATQRSNRNMETKAQVRHCPGRTRRRAEERQTYCTHSRYIGRGICSGQVFYKG